MVKKKSSHEDIHPVRKFKAKGKSNRLSDKLITGLSNGAEAQRAQRDHDSE